MIAVPPSVDLSSRKARQTLEVLEARAAKYGVTISVHRVGERTTVRVNAEYERTNIATNGAVLSLIDLTLTDYQEGQRGTWSRDAAWAPDELVQIAVQSGMDVSRA